jgi:hypothetical protein
MNDKKHPSEVHCPKCGARPGKACEYRGVSLRGWHEQRRLYAAGVPNPRRTRASRRRGVDQSGYFSFMRDGR